METIAGNSPEKDLEEKVRFESLKKCEYIARQVVPDPWANKQESPVMMTVVDNWTRSKMSFEYCSLQ